MRLSRDDHVRPVVATSISQAFSAASNFVILLALGRAAGAGEVGRYALAFATYGAALGFQRAAITDALMARAPGSTAAETVESGNTVSMCLALATCAAVVAFVVGMITPYRQLALVAPFLAGMLVEDACRYVTFRRGRHELAVVLDGLWLAMSCTAFVVLRRFPDHNAAILVWGSAGSLAGVAGMVVMRVRPGAPRAAFQWWKSHLWRSCRWLSTEALFYHADKQVVAFGFTALAGAKLFGEYQIALSLVGVSVFFTSGIGILTITHLTRRAGADSRPAWWSAAACFGCVVAWTLVLVSMSGFVLHVLYHGRVVVPTAMLLASGAITAVAAASSGPQLLLLARQTERVLPVARGVALLLFAPLAVVVSRWNFEGALWLLVLDGLAYLGIVGWAAFRAPRRARTSELAYSA